MTEIIKIDRRIQRTRQLLKDALMALILEKDYADITVQDILDRANLGRATFYLHYQGKEDLLLKAMEEIVHRLVENIGVSFSGETEDSEVCRIMDTRPIFEHAQQQYHLHMSLVAGRGMDITIKTIRDHLSKHMQERIESLKTGDKNDFVPSPVIANFLAGSLLNLLVWWLENKMPFSPDRMDEMFQQLTMPGILKAVNITKN